MKKTLLAAVAALTLSTAAVAQVKGVYGTAGFAYDNVQGGPGQRTGLAVGAIADTSVGKFDGSVTVQSNRFGKEDDVAGFDVGYSNGLQLTAGTLTGRVGYGRRNLVDLGTNFQFYTVGLEFAAPVAPKTGVFVGYRHRNTFDSGSDFAEGRFSAGVDYQVDSKIGVRVGATLTEVGGVNLRGVALTGTYKF